MEIPGSGLNWSLAETSSYLHSIVSSCLLRKTIQKNKKRKSLSIPRDKNETSSSQPCISRYDRPWIVYLVPDREMLRWYLTDSGVTVFNQPLAIQDLSGLFLNLYPSRVESILLLTLRYSGTSLISVTTNLLQTGCFLENTNKVMATVDLLLRPSYQWAKTQKKSKEPVVGREFGDANLKSRLSIRLIRAEIKAMISW